MSVKVHVRRQPRTRTTEYHLEVHALVRVPDEVIAIDQKEVEAAIVGRLRQAVLDLAQEPGVRFDREMF